MRLNEMDLFSGEKLLEFPSMALLQDAHDKTMSLKVSTYLSFDRCLQELQVSNSLFRNTFMHKWM